MLNVASLDFKSEFDAHYGLLAPEQTVLVRSYVDDSNDQVLADIHPRFIVMFESNRGIEVGNDISGLVGWMLNRAIS